MNVKITLEEINRAWASKDPDLAEFILQLVRANDPEPEKEPRKGALTFRKYLTEVRSYRFQEKSDEEKGRYRQEQWKLLEAEDAEAPLPDRFRLYIIILELWRANGPYERDCLFQIIENTPLKWGPWRALKRIYKESEQIRDTEMFGALATRFDTALAARDTRYEVTSYTLIYLVRRAWRYLRQEAGALPACYADACMDLLRFYPENTSWSNTWVANHILYHESGEYGKSTFTYYSTPDALEERAFPDLWKRTPRPLFSLLERARAERIRSFAIGALKNDFPVALREVEANWVVRLIAVGSESIDEFVVWLLENSPRFAQDHFKEHGLHLPMLDLLNSNSAAARKYAAAYTRVYARDLELDRLLKLVNNKDKVIRKLAQDLLGERDPRKDVGLEAWSSLLGTEYANDLAVKTLANIFGPRELTAQWFHERLLEGAAFAFASEHLLKIHSHKELGAGYFHTIFDDERLTQKAAEFLLNALLEFPEMDAVFLRRFLLHPYTRKSTTKFIGDAKLDVKLLGCDFLKVLVFRPDWEADEWITSIMNAERARLGEDADLDFNSRLAQKARTWLGDVRNFEPGELGLNWLLKMAAGSDSSLHDFAVDYIVRAFQPFHFAGPVADEEQPASTAAQAMAGMSVLFTGKLSSMTRDEAQQKVKDAGGKNASGVSSGLNFLVIGDEGSPLYGEGDKGSKQKKAEELIAQGGATKIISEKDFLSLAAGKAGAADPAAVLQGCEKLWEMLTTKGEDEEDPIRLLALKYIRAHHPVIGPIHTERPVEARAEIPLSFLTFERLTPLFKSKLNNLRQLSLDIALRQMADWEYTALELLRLCEGPHENVRDFIARALLAEDSPANKEFRVPSDKLSANDLYLFCESLNNFSRNLGMNMIKRNPAMAAPEELFRLTESPDRQVRSFVVRTIWELYRERGLTKHWKVPVRKAEVKKASEEEIIHTGLPEQPKGPPAEGLKLRDFMRVMLFELPPPRPSSRSPQSTKPLPARKAKLYMIDVFRDMAVEDAAFAEIITPLLGEFKDSRGLSERAACLTALTRIEERHGIKPAAAAQA